MSKYFHVAAIPNGICGHRHKTIKAAFACHRRLMILIPDKVTATNCVIKDERDTVVATRTPITASEQLAYEVFTTMGGTWVGHL